MTRYLYSTPVAGHKYAQACVNHFSDGTIELQSYATRIISITPDGWLSCTGTYSMTTIKHIGWFMRERGMSYYLAKQMYLDNKEYNINTGEVRSRG